MKITIKAIDKKTNTILVKGDLKYWFRAIAETGKNPFNNDKIDIKVEI